MLLKQLKNPAQVFQYTDSTLYVWEDNDSKELATSIIKNTKSKTQATNTNAKTKNALFPPYLQSVCDKQTLSEKELDQYYNYFYEEVLRLDFSDTNLFEGMLKMSSLFYHLLTESSAGQKASDLVNLLSRHISCFQEAVKEHKLSDIQLDNLEQTIREISEHFITTPFYSSFVAQNEYVKTTRGKTNMDGYKSRDAEFMFHIKVGYFYKDLLEFWAILNIDDKSYIDQVIKHLEEVVTVDYHDCRTLLNQYRFIMPILHYYHHKNEYATQELEKLLERLSNSSQKDEKTVLKDLKIIIKKIDSLHTLKIDYYSELIAFYNKLHVTTVTAEHIQQVISSSYDLFSIHPINYKNLGKGSYVINNLLSLAFGLHKWGGISYHEKEQYQTLQQAIAIAEKLKSESSKKEAIWADLFIQRAQSNIADYELVKNADTSKFVTIAEELQKLGVLHHIPTEESIKEIIYDSKPKQKNKIAKELLYKAKTIIHFDAEAGFVPLPYLSLLDDLFAVCKQTDLPNLNYTVQANLTEKASYEYQYHILLTTQNYTFIFEEDSASDYYSNDLATAFNQMLKIVGVKKQFHEQYTNDQTCLLFYGTSKQLQNANQQYKLFKKKKRK